MFLESMFLEMEATPCGEKQQGNQGASLAGGGHSNSRARGEDGVSADRGLCMLPAVTAQWSLRQGREACRASPPHCPTCHNESEFSKDNTASHKGERVACESQFHSLRKGKFQNNGSIRKDQKELQKKSWGLQDECYRCTVLCDLEVEARMTIKGVSVGFSGHCCKTSLAFCRQCIEIRESWL